MTGECCQPCEARRPAKTRWDAHNPTHLCTNSRHGPDRLDDARTLHPVCSVLAYALKRVPRRSRYRRRAGCAADQDQQEEERPHYDSNDPPNLGESRGISSARWITRLPALTDLIGEVERDRTTKETGHQERDDSQREVGRRLAFFGNDSVRRSHVLGRRARHQAHSSAEGMQAAGIWGRGRIVRTIERIFTHRDLDSFACSSEAVVRQLFLDRTPIGSMSCQTSAIRGHQPDLDTSPRAGPARPATCCPQAFLLATPRHR